MRFFKLISSWSHKCLFFLRVKLNLAALVGFWSQMALLVLEVADSWFRLRQTRLSSSPLDVQVLLLLCGGIISNSSQFSWFPPGQTVTRSVMVSIFPRETSDKKGIDLGLQSVQLIRVCTALSVPS